jgi:hypothetical protein
MYGAWTVLNRSSHSQILLVLLSAGDAYIVDLRKKYQTRVELCEVEDEAEEEAQMNKPRYLTSHFHSNLPYDQNIDQL